MALPKGFPGHMVKGSVLKNRQSYLASVHGDAAAARLQGHVDSHTFSIISGTVLATRWYDFRINLDLDVGIAAVLGTPTKAFYASLGDYSAVQEISKAYSVLLAEAQPDRLLRRASQLWSRSFTPGTLSYRSLGPKAVVLRLDGFTNTEPNCWTTHGFFARLLQQTGVTEVEVAEEFCTGRGDDRCEYACRWA